MMSSMLQVLFLTDSVYISDVIHVAGPLLGRFCAAHLPSSLESSDNQVHIRFVSDDTYSEGFGQIRWQASLECK